MTEKQNEKKTMIRVLVVDDHAIIRKGVRAVLDLEPDIDLGPDYRRWISITAK